MSTNQKVDIAVKVLPCVQLSLMGASWNKEPKFFISRQVKIKTTILKILENF